MSVIDPYSHLFAKKSWYFVFVKSIWNSVSVTLSFCYHSSDSTIPYSPETQIFIVRLLVGHLIVSTASPTNSVISGFHFCHLGRNIGIFFHCSAQLVFKNFHLDLVKSQIMSTKKKTWMTYNLCLKRYNQKNQPISMLTNTKHIDPCWHLNMQIKEVVLELSLQIPKLLISIIYTNL